jgi:hypothetical protein
VAEGVDVLDFGVRVFVEVGKNTPFDELTRVFVAVGETDCVTVAIGGLTRILSVLVGSTEAGMAVSG